MAILGSSNVEAQRDRVRAQLTAGTEREGTPPPYSLLGAGRDDKAPGDVWVLATGCTHGVPWCTVLLQCVRGGRGTLCRPTRDDCTTLRWRTAKAERSIASRSGTATTKASIVLHRDEDNSKIMPCHVHVYPHGIRRHELMTRTSLLCRKSS